MNSFLAAPSDSHSPDRLSPTTRVVQHAARFLRNTTAFGGAAGNREVFRREFADNYVEFGGRHRSP